MALQCYIYCADVYCEACGQAIRARLTAEGKSPAEPADEATYDSDDFPKGPMEAGMADTPDHCGAGEACLEPTEVNGDRYGRFLENELTEDGVRHLEEALWKSVGEHSELAEQWGIWYRAMGYEIQDPKEPLGELLEWYQEKCGDYLAIDPDTAEEDRGSGPVYKGRAASLVGKPGSVGVTLVCAEHLSHCRAVAEDEVPNEWRRAIMPMPVYTVIVGNVGTIYDGPHEEHAVRLFKEYVEQSKSGHERVTLFKNGEPVMEHSDQWEG